jgi:hypothetical protein
MSSFITFVEGSGALPVGQREKRESRYHFEERDTIIGINKPLDYQAVSTAVDSPFCAGGACLSEGSGPLSDQEEPASLAEVSSLHFVEIHTARKPTRIEPHGMIPSLDLTVDQRGHLLPERVEYSKRDM